MNVPKLVGDVVEQWLKRGEGRPTVVFASGVAHSLHLRDSFRAAGVLAEHIDGETPTAERDATLTQLADGTVNVVCNAMVLTEGWDCPAVSCIVLARPTRKLGLFRQMVGRGLRPHPGKTDCLIIDHSGAVHAHGFPDDDIEWTLEPDRTAGENGAHDARQDKHSARGILECSMCSALRVAGEACAACGFLPPPPPPRAVACLPGDLDEVDRSGRTIPAQEHSHDERMLFFGEMAAYGPPVASSRDLQRPGTASATTTGRPGVPRRPASTRSGRRRADGCSRAPSPTRAPGSGRSGHERRKTERARRALCDTAHRHA